jgi:hypothetical protein
MQLVGGVEEEHLHQQGAPTVVDLDVRGGGVAKEKPGSGGGALAAGAMR